MQIFLVRGYTGQYLVTTSFVLQGPSEDQIQDQS